MAQVIKADLDEMVFEDRERRYGGYFLRKRYPKILLYSTLIGLLVTAMIPASSYVSKMLGLSADVEENSGPRNVVINMEDLPPPPPIDEEKPPPPPPPKPPPPQIKTVAFKIPEPAPEEEIDPEEDQTINEQEELKDAPVISLEDQEGDDDVGFIEGDIDGEGDIPEVVIEKEPDVNAFIVVEEEPKPVNMNEVKQAIGYPQVARDAGIEGNVVVRVLVDKNGGYKRHVILNGVHPVLEKAVAAQLPKLRFTPAIQGGKPIQFWVNIPFAFKLIQ
ncbi:MAG: energy transducer TonB [Bacteroidota bacterium]